MDSNLLKQIAERSLLTFMQSFLAMFVITDLSSARGAAVAGLAAVLSVLKSAVATRIGDHESASLV